MPEPSGDSSDPIIFNKSSIIDPLAVRWWVHVETYKEKERT